MVKLAATFCVAVAGGMSFLVQPMLGRMLLPELGGGAGVWIMVSIAFQSGILAGYVYALWLLKRSRSSQIFIHVSLMILSSLLLMGSWLWEPSGGISALFVAGLVAAYLVLASTSPLVQGWLSLSTGHHSWDLQSVYRLFTFSNLAGIVALFSYPFAVETSLGLRAQSIVWILLFFAYSVLLAYLAVKVSQKMPTPAAGETARTPWAIWLGVPLLTTAYLLGLTTAFTQTIPSAPFLWTVPLALYLFSYAIVFAGLYGRMVRLICSSILIFIFSAALFGTPGGDSAWRIGNFPLHCALMFIGCVIFHGELYLRKPTAPRLPNFYVSLSVGGLLGGIFAAVIIPTVFSSYRETWLFHFLFAATAAWLLFSKREAPPTIGHSGTGRMDIFRIIGRTLTVVVFLFLYWVSLFAGQSQGDWNQVRAVRNFYGAYKVVDRFGNNPRRILDHGGVNHGAQYSTIGESGKPTTYYTGDGGMGVAFRVLQSEQKPIEAVCVGVGVGTAAAWVGNRDRLTFVDIDPDIFTIAQEDFSFIGDAQARGATVDLVVGDGRKALEKFPKDAADLVVLDAFVGGGIPVHLLTQEALSLYTNLLNPEGILAVHVSSTTLNLEGLVETGLRRLGMKTAVLKSDGGKDGIGSCWVLASKSPSRVAALRAMGGGGEPLAKETIIWTDDFSPLFPIVR